MDLRKVEQELERISSDWTTLRTQRPRFDDGVVPDSCIVRDISSRMPSWVELSSGVDDDALFPPEEEEEGGGEGCRGDDGDVGPTVVNPTHPVVNYDNDTTAADDDGPTTTIVDTEFGMCLVGTSGKKNTGASDASDNSNDPKDRNSIWEKYAAKNARSKDNEPPIVVVKAPFRSEDDANISDSDENEPIHVVDVSPKTLLAGLESLHERFVALRPRIDKLNAKLREVSFMCQE
jgi:hypothetical protein